MLERLDAPDADGALYGPKVQLDDLGDAMVLQMTSDELERAGDYRFDVELTVTGMLQDGEMGEVAVETLCYTPSRNNEANATFCYEDASLARTTYTPETTGCAGKTSRRTCNGETGCSWDGAACNATADDG